MPRNPPYPPLQTWPEALPVPLDHPELPDAIGEAFRALGAPACHLHRVPCPKVVEWWVLDDDGELVEAFWLEK